MEHAIAFAETGHLALGTLHANNANQALDRIINFFPEERRPQLLMDQALRRVGSGSTWLRGANALFGAAISMRQLRKRLFR